MPLTEQQQAAGSKRSPELADIFRAYGQSYRQAHPLPRSQLKVMVDLAQPSPIGKKSARQLLPEVTGFDLARCPACHVGILVILAPLPAIEVAPYSTRAPPLDSS